METTFIYALVDPTTKQIRYIGKANNIKKRLQEHHQLCRLKGRTHKNNWIKSLLKKGLRAEIQILEECRKDDWQDRERYFISKYKNDPNCKLTNTAEGGAGEFRRSYIPEMTDEIKAKISLKVKQRHQEGIFKDSHKKLSKIMQGKSHLPERKTSKYIGVIMTPSLNWSASIGYKNSHIHLGRFLSEKDAAIAYDCKARELFGPNARTNFKEIIPCPKNTVQGQTSKYKGISLVGKKWQTTIFVDGKKYYLGSFSTEDEAWNARCASIANLMSN